MLQGNVVGAAGSFVYGTGATTYDIRLQDVLTDTIAKNVIGTTTGRCGANGHPVVQAQLPLNSNHAI